MNEPILVATAIAGSLTASPLLAQFEWTHLGGDATRNAVAVGTPGPLANPHWALAADRSGNPIAFVGQSGIVVAGERVFAIGKVGSQHYLIAADRGSGQVAWQTNVPAPVLDSFSTPVIDRQNGTVLVASGSGVTALDMRTGAQLWQTTLSRNVVNASPLVTTDRLRRDRAFVTDYDGFGVSSRLYCINVDRFHAALNPYQPGAIVWSVPIGTGAGSTPAYRDGVVFVATAGDFGFSPGEILAYPADATTAPQPIWTFTNTIDEGFYGPVTIQEVRGSEPHVYAASYAFYGGQFSSNLVKVNARTGTLVWSTPSNRTRSTPIVLGDGTILLSTGLAGFGSVPSIQAFRDASGQGTLLWDSAVATWVDADGDHQIDPEECLLLGGWCTQPACVAGNLVLYTGVIPLGGGFFGACTDFYALDARQAPGSAGFVLERFAGAGSSPALVGSNAYTIGASGLYAFGPHPRLDVNADGFADADDVAAWEQGVGNRDVDMNGQISEHDHEILLEGVGADEHRD